MTRLSSIAHPSGRQARGRLLRGAATAGLAAAIGLAAAAPAAAQANPPVSPELFARFAPPIFDFVVTLSRNVAVITFEDRGGDPVTGDLWVEDLAITRDQLDVRIGRLTYGPAGLTATDVEVETRDIALPPEARRILSQLDLDTVRFDVAMIGEGEIETASFDYTVALQSEGLGRLVVEADVEGFHVLVPLDELAETSENEDAGSQIPDIRGDIAGGTIAFTDDGLVEKALAIAGEMQGVEAGDLAVGLSVQSQMMLGGLAGENADQKALAEALAQGVSGLLRDGEPLRITLQPTAPVPFQALIDMPPSLAWLTVLGARVNEAARVAPEDVAALPDPARAEAYLDGRIVPQNAGEAYRIASAAFEAGELGAASIMLRAGRLTGALSPEDAYYAALLAKADGATGIDEAAMRAGLDAGTVHDLQTRAFEAWHGGGASSAHDALDLAARQGDMAAAQALARRFRSGDGLPVNDARAYGYASVAAAGGDMIARIQRDTLAAAVARDLVAPAAIEAGAALASDIWAQASAE